MSRSQNPTKHRKPAAKEAHGSAPMDAKKLKRLYSTMLKCRIVAERARLLCKQGKLPGNFCATTGREAAEVGALVDLLPHDCVAPGPSDFTARIIQSTPLKWIFYDFYTQHIDSNNRPDLQKRRVHAPRTMIAPAFSQSAQLNLATGVALASKTHAKPSVAVVFSDDDSAPFDFWHDAVKFSIKHKLPVLFVVHHNSGDGSITARLEAIEQDRRPTGENQYLPVFNVDGNDVVAVYRVAQEAIRRARQGHGPALIECQTYGWCDRADTESGKSAVELDRSSDPIARMEDYLKQKRLWSDQWKKRLVEGFVKELDRAVEFAGQSQGRLGPLARGASSSLATAS